MSRIFTSSWRIGAIFGKRGTVPARYFTFTTGCTQHTKRRSIPSTRSLTTKVIRNPFHLQYILLRLSGNGIPISNSCEALQTRRNTSYFILLLRAGPTHRGCRRTPLTRTSRGVAFQPGAFQDDAFQTGNVKQQSSTGDIEFAVLAQSVFHMWNQVFTDEGW